MDLSPSKVNNLNLIRLLAALQVVLLHLNGHLKIKSPLLTSLLDVVSYFPGVPIFFIISGFLIFWTIDRSFTNYYSFWRNRILRIYPALWMSTIVTVFILFSFGQIFAEEKFIWNEIVWVFGQLTFAQFYTIPSLRDFGVGVPNGALWTITVELQFYLIVPLLYRFCIRSKWMLIVLFGLSLLFCNFLKILPEVSLARKLAEVTVFPYLFYFLIGAGIFLYWVRIKILVENKFIFWLAVYGLYVFIFSHTLHLSGHDYFPNIFGLISIFILSFLIISAAFTNTTLNNQIIGGSDISYGMYLYHMPLANCFIAFGFVSNKTYFFVLLVILVVIAWLSWSFIEKPCLRFKKIKF